VDRELPIIGMVLLEEQQLTLLQPGGVPGGLPLRAGCPVRAFLVILYTTGLRLREAMNLTWHDVDLQK